MNHFHELGSSFTNLNKNKIIDLSLYGKDKFDNKKYQSISMSTIKLIKGSQMFDEQLL